MKNVSMPYSRSRLLDPLRSLESFLMPLSVLVRREEKSSKLVARKIRIVEL